MEPNESFTDFTLSIIDELQQENRFSTAHIYQYALRALTQSIGGGTLFWGGLTQTTLKKFQEYLEKHQKSYNTVSTYIRVVRAIYNRAIDRKVITGYYRLFANLSTGISAEHKIALTAEQMSRLLSNEAAYPLHGDIRRAQDYLQLMILLQGMPFTDLAHLRKADLRGNMLTCRRQKTGTELCVQLMPQAVRLIEKYRSQDDESPYLLNILSGKLNGKEAFDEYRNQLRKLNFNLARLSKHCKMEEVKVSSYTARHTWATLAKYCQVPEEVISEGLGHSSLEITRTYLKSFEAEELNRANKIVNNYINTGKKMIWKQAI